MVRALGSLDPCAWERKGRAHGLEAPVGPPTRGTGIRRGPARCPTPGRAGCASLVPAHRGAAGIRGGVNPDAGVVVLHGKSPATRTSFLSAGPVGPVEATRTLAEDIDTAVLSTSSRWRTLRPWTSPPVLRRSSPPRRHQPGPCRSATTASCPTAR